MRVLNHTETQHISDNGSCFLPQISRSVQKNFYSSANFVILPITAVMGLWCFVSNTSIIIAVLRLGLQHIRPGLLILCSLTLTDVIWGSLIVLPYVGFRFKDLVTGNICSDSDELKGSIWSVSFFLGFIGAIGNLAVMSIDRYLAVSRAMQYRFLINSRRAFVACSLTWLTSFLYGVLRRSDVVPDNTFRTMTTSFVVIGAAVVIVIQAMTLRILRRHNSRVADMTAETQRVNPALNAANAATERQLTVTVSYVVGILVLIFIPSACLISVLHLANLPILHIVDPLFFLGVTTCSSINPIIYHRKNAEIRNAISKLVKCRC